MFLNLLGCLRDEIATPLDSMFHSGTYAIVHFMGYDVLEIPQKICNYTELIKLFLINMMIAFLNQRMV